MRSTRTTGNDPVEGLDPGGTRSTRPGRRDKQADKQVTHTVTSGDRNPPEVPQRAARPRGDLGTGEPNEFI